MTGVKGISFGTEMAGKMNQTGKSYLQETMLAWDGKRKKCIFWKVQEPLIWTGCKEV